MYKYSREMNPEVVMISEEIQSIAGDNRLLPTLDLQIVLEGQNTDAYVSITAVSEKVLDLVIGEIDSHIYGKYNRNVVRNRNKLLVTAPVAV